MENYTTLKASCKCGNTCDKVTIKDKSAGYYRVEEILYCDKCGERTTVSVNEISTKSIETINTNQ